MQTKPIDDENPRVRDELDQANEPVQQSSFDLERAIAEARADGEDDGAKLHISEDVVQEIARRALTCISSVKPANIGSSVLGIGRKNPEGVRVSLEEGEQPQISVDAYVLVRYGLRIPDVAWDLQEFLKNELEKSTGYEVKTVNIYVQGVYFAEQDKQERQTAQAVPATAGE